MYVVIMHHWQEASAQQTQALAAVLQVTAFDARQRLFGRGPAVVATFAELDPAQALLMKLQQAGFRGFVVDTSATRARNSFYMVHRFELADAMLHVKEAGGRSCRVTYREVNLLLPATRFTGHAETQTVTERKISMGKTLMTGGLPMARKIKRQVVLSSEERERVLYLYAANRPWFLFPQGGMVYDGLGAKMNPSREMNFNALVAELRLRCPAAFYDDRLLNRAGQPRLLGPLLRPEANLDLAVEILAREAEG
jgi:hypothetical protein